MSNERANIQHCPATRKDGTPCRGQPNSSGWCIGHDPRAQTWREHGGTNRSASERADKRLPARLRDIADLLRRAIYEAYSGALPSQRAGAVAALARALIACIQVGELEQAVQELEQRAEQAAQSGPRRGRDRRGAHSRYQAPASLASLSGVLVDGNTGSTTGGDTWMIWPNGGTNGSKGGGGAWQD